MNKPDPPPGGQAASAGGLAAALACAALAAGCSSSSSSSSPPAPSQVATSSAAAASASPSATAVAGPPACAASALTVTQSAPDGYAGGFDVTIGFTNASGASCTLYGYPGVSLVSGSRAQIDISSRQPSTREEAAEADTCPRYRSVPGPALRRRAAGRRQWSYRRASPRSYSCSRG